MEFWASEGWRITALILAGVGFLLQVDNLIEAFREARKGGDTDPPNEEKASPPE